MVFFLFGVRAASLIKYSSEFKWLVLPICPHVVPFMYDLFLKGVFLNSYNVDPSENHPSWWWYWNLVIQLLFLFSLLCGCLNLSPLVQFSKFPVEALFFSLIPNISLAQPFSLILFENNFLLFCVLLWIFLYYFPSKSILIYIFYRPAAFLCNRFIFSVTMCFSCCILGRR